MSSKDIVRISGRDVDRKALEAMGRELRDHHTKTNRLNYLRKRIPEIVHESPAPPDGMPRGSNVSNPTLSKVMRIDELQDEAYEINAWMGGIASVLDSLTDGQREIIQQLYLLPRNEREYTMVGLAKRLNMSEREAYYSRDEALVEFALVLHGEAALQNPCSFFADCYLKDKV